MVEVRAMCGRIVEQRKLWSIPSAICQVNTSYVTNQSSLVTVSNLRISNDRLLMMSVHSLRHLTLHHSSSSSFQNPGNIGNTNSTASKIFLGFLVMSPVINVTFIIIRCKTFKSYFIIPSLPSTLPELLSFQIRRRTVTPSSAFLFKSSPK